jgi:hypothetical protein
MLSSNNLVLVKGVERKMKLNFLAKDNKHSVDLYGHNFAKIDFNIIKDCIEILSPPTISNIVAMEAPKGCSYVILRKEDVILRKE